ncbi:nuclear pore complex protein Nup88 isoform X2 [Coccinella septempunctata]|uniref:nuclear pore complex protein Nup88 isoform X2 n=1 Tax=Coccinella septempunctata TaxID=41139 RepID=UPI001D0794AF|nr:nuclear pore complex protein Nup88 isoform X2 [Coccinella septempunctata]
MNSTDFLNLGDNQIVELVKNGLPRNISKTVNVLTVKDDVLFTWDFQSHCVLTLNIKAARENKGVICQKLLPLSPPIFSPEKIIANENGSLLVVAGPNGVLVFQLPTRCPPYGSYNNNKELVYCRTFSLDERLFMCTDDVEVLQVKFHPGSVKDNHVLLLTSDNTLRLYQVEDEVVCIGTFVVGDKPMAKVPCSKMTFLGALGEIAVDFDFGHPEINEKEAEKRPTTRDKEKESPDQSLVRVRDPFTDTESLIPVHQQQSFIKKSEKMKERENYSNFNWPVYVLSADFIITTVDIPLYEKKGYTVKGPIPLMPNNFFPFDKRACSIVCLNSTPQVVCIGSTHGEIFHGVVLPIEEKEDKENQLNTSSSNQGPADKEIYFFEAVDIEFGLSTVTECQEEGYTCPIFLHRDESRCDRYFATHSAGVHTVHVGCMEDLQKFVVSEDSSDVFNIPSTVEYLVCTKTSSTKNQNPVIGFSVYYNPNSIITLLANGCFMSLALINAEIVIPKLEQLVLQDTETAAPSMQDMMKMPFNQHILKLLKKADSHPILKLSKNEEHSLKECHELFQRTVLIFREKIKCHQIAREEIEKRATALAVFKDYQLKELANMNHEKRSLQETAENLAEKYEEIKENQEKLLKRCAKLLVQISMKKEVLSDAENDYLLNLKKMRAECDKFDSVIDKLIVKKNYQETQMRSWKKQQQRKSYTISETHKNTIKDNLVDSSKRINEMIEEIKGIKKQLRLN